MDDGIKIEIINQPQISEEEVRNFVIEGVACQLPSS